MVARFIRWVLSVAFTALVLLFSLMNRTPVPVQWSPIHPVFDVPLFLPVLTGVLGGFVLGAFMVWLNGAAARRERGQQKKLIKKLEKELEAAGTTIKQKPVSAGQADYKALTAQTP